MPRPPRRQLHLLWQSGKLLPHLGPLALLVLQRRRVPSRHPSLANGNQRLLRPLQLRLSLRNRVARRGGSVR